MNNDLFIASLIFIGLGIAQIIWIKSILTETKKMKQILFVIMTILGEKEKELGKDISLKELYKKAEDL